jgi:hypothetical protein
MSDLSDAKGKVRIFSCRWPDVKHDRGVEEVAGVQLVRCRVAEIEMRRRGPVCPGLLACHE